MIVLGIETSCDETAVAVLNVGKQAKILSNLVASQHEIHAPYGGIFPELASRRHIEVLKPLVENALKEAGVPRQKLDGVAVTNAPGLVGALLVGLSFAKAFAFGLGIPFIGVNHLEGHLNAPFLDNSKIRYPHVAMIVSGGHTALYFVKKFGEYQFLGGTRDDAAGEAFDKVAKILNLGYPGGPAIDRLAREGNPNAIKFPKPRLKVAPRDTAQTVVCPSPLENPKVGTAPDLRLSEERGCKGSQGYDFSFSGLKTAVKSVCERNESETKNICASFQETVVDILIEKTLAAAKNRRCKTVLITGGVACNSRLREKMAKAARGSQLAAHFASPILSSDNAAMIAYVGARYLAMGRQSPHSLNAFASLDLRTMT